MEWIIIAVILVIAFTLLVDVFCGVHSYRSRDALREKETYLSIKTSYDSITASYKEMMKLTDNVTRPRLPGCKHPDAIAVDSIVTGEILAYWCGDCGTQLMPDEFQECLHTRKLQYRDGIWCTECFKLVEANVEPRG